ncbi:MAG: hypothetical protein U5L45_25555 [Saprospiraceae bacterium]|nr:hypothetical protein [Saprospiraceae bacterium]
MPACAVENHDGVLVLGEGLGEAVEEICMVSALTVGRTSAKAASPPGRAAPKR